MEQQVITYTERPVFIRLSMMSFNRSLKQHIEDEVCFMFVNKGEVGVRSQDGLHQFDPSVGMLAKCMNYFFEPIRGAETCAEGIETIGVFIYPSMVRDLFDAELSPEGFDLDYHLSSIAIEGLLRNFRQSVEILLNHPELADERIVKTKLKEFILLMAKAHDAPSELEFLSAIFKPKDIEFRAVIKSNLFSSLSIEELAVLCHMSLATFKRRFKETFQDTPRKYIIAKKLERAAKLLLNQDLRISDIAYDVGFESLATFNRNFNQTYGISPSTYRLNRIEKSLS